jgi:hypothetical protein
VAAHDRLRLLLSTVVAFGCGLNFPLALATHWLAVLAHPTANVLNGLHGTRNGADTAHTHDMATFKGGSCLFQARATSERQTVEQAHALLTFQVPAGLLLALWVISGWILLLGITDLGLFCTTSAVGVTHSLCEATVALAWLLVAIGTDLVQRGGRSFSSQPGCR